MSHATGGHVRKDSESVTSDPERESPLELWGQKQPEKQTGPKKAQTGRGDGFSTRAASDGTGRRAWGLRKRNDFCFKESSLSTSITWENAARERKQFQMQEKERMSGAAGPHGGQEGGRP